MAVALGRRSNHYGKMVTVSRAGFADADSAVWLER